MMLLFGFLAIITLLLILATVCVVACGGVIGIILFSDVIVCVAILVFIMKKLFKKNK